MAPGEILGLVGESGSGKSTLGRTVVRLQDPIRGSIRFHDVDLAGLSDADLIRHRRRVQMIFQDPYASLDPRQTAAAIVAEPIRNFGLARGSEATRRAIVILEQVGIAPDQASYYPHEFSGGQRQRIAIARALAAEPELIVCDEPVSALDVSIRAQIINLLAELRRDRGIALLFIAHDLAVVRHLADRVAVMYRGRIVELAGTAALFADPRHPYTRALLAAVPVPDPARPIRASDEVIGGPLPEQGCPYAPRCGCVADACRSDAPILVEVAPGHRVACGIPTA